MFNKNIYFIDKGHKYINIITKKKLISVTTAIKIFQDDFNEDYWSKYKAKQHNVSQEEILFNWKIKKDIGLWLGSLVHSYIENYKLFKIIDIDIPLSFFSSLSSPQLLKLIEYRNNLLFQANCFLNDYKDYNYIASELVIGNDLIAGQVDYLTDACIIDFKNDLAIDYTNKWQSFKKPLHHLEDCNYNKYCLQVSMYRYLLEEKGLYLEEKDKIIKFDRFSKNYEVIEIPYLKNECEIILHYLNK